MKEIYEPTTGEFSVLVRAIWNPSIIYHSWGDAFEMTSPCGLQFGDRDAIPYRILDPARARPCRKCYRDVPRMSTGEA